MGKTLNDRLYFNSEPRFNDNGAVEETYNKFCSLLENLHLRLDNLSSKIQVIENKVNTIQNVTGETERHLSELTITNQERVGLEDHYIDILLYMLNLDSCLDNDSSIQEDSVIYIKSEMNRVLEEYGYNVVDFSQENLDFYDLEYQPITEDIQLVRRAIVNDKGRVVVKGKVYIKNKK